jgi:hypothetical protein
MDPYWYGVIELGLVFGFILAIAIRELIVTRRALHSERDKKLKRGNLKL